MAVLSPGLYKFIIDGVDVTSMVKGAKVSKAYNQPIKTLSLSLNRNVDSLLMINNDVLGSSITVQRGVSVSTERYVFRGEIVTYKPQGSLYTVSASDKLYVTSRREYDYTFDINTDVEAGVASEIVKTLFTYVGLPYNNSTVVSTGTTADFTLIKYPVKGNIIGTLKDLCNLYDYQVFYNDSEDLTYFIPKGYTSTTTTLTTGIDIRNRIEWLNTVEDTNNNITLIGGEQLDWNTETFAGPATTVTLGATPVDTDVYVNSTVKVARGVNSTDPKDFYVDGKNLVFTVSSSNIVVKYSYNVPTKTTAVDFDSIDNYNQRDVTIINSKLTNTSDTELRAANYLESQANPLTSAPLWVIGNNDLELGQEITVIDNINKLTKMVVVTNIEYNYPFKYDIVTVGKRPSQALDLQANIIDSIVKLQRQLSADTDINTQLITLPQQVDIFGYDKIEEATADSGVLYWDSDTQGTWDDYDWGTDSEESYGVTSLIPSNNIIFEDFYSTEFKDASSTATWSNAGVASFINGQIALSKYYLKDLENTISSLILTANYSGNLVFEVSCDGSNWEIVVSTISHPMVATGHYLYWRATSTGSSTINNVKIQYNI